MSTVYVAVTGDAYELPVAIADTAAELARTLGVNENTIYKQIHNQKCGLVKGSKKALKYYKVELEDTDGD